MARIVKKSLAIGFSLALLGLAGCSAPEVSRGINDPHEERNRRVHEFTKKLDSGLLKPLSSGYGGSTPETLQKGVGNFAGNLSTPGYFVNDVLQGKVDDAVHNLVRFVFNSTLGLAGVFDPASSIGLEERSSDFGETLHTWGVGEGAYVELPLLGPSTERDAVGKVVDMFTNPLSYALPKPERLVIPVADGLAGVGTRYRYGELVDEILYDSADSYAQARLLYLERRRHQLGLAPGAAIEEEYDPDANPFAEYE